MLPNNQEQYDSLKRKLEALLQRLNSSSGEELSFKAGPDKWSVVEVVEHLVIAEKDLLNQLSTNIPASTLDPEAKTPEKYQIVIKVMERDIEVDVPHESMEPHGRLTLDDLVNQWNDIREKLQGLLAEIHADNKDDLVYRHPYGGPLDISETLHFFDVHYDNHMRHIDRILAQTK
ncbi:hypothetical protein D1BOALGB6SA_7969 [Olavius sp. associated proteobacterium Delta 1]|nr:hypothetical protein D1BOALGB6SA_7969 [Olavius sp. associated proteobacterium Delta 1]